MDTATLALALAVIREGFGARVPPACLAGQPSSVRRVPSNASRSNLAMKLASRKDGALSLNAGRRNSMACFSVPLSVKSSPSNGAACQVHRQEAASDILIWSIPAISAGDGAQNFNGVRALGHHTPGGAGAWHLASPTSSAADGLSWRKSIGKDVLLVRHIKGCDLLADGAVEFSRGGAVH